jgi:hypothetical protein
MKLRLFALFSVLFAIQGCSSSTTVDPTAFDFSQINNEYLKNVSDINGVVTLYSGSWTGIDITWKDSNGKLDSLSTFAGKVVLLSFWKTNSANAFAEESTLDSVQTDLGDSVVIVSLAEDNTASTNSFQTVSAFVAAHNIKHQVVVDSSQRAQGRYVGSSLGYPETLALRTNGSIQSNEFIEGWDSVAELDSLVRAAYH